MLEAGPRACRRVRRTAPPAAATAALPDRRGRRAAGDTKALAVRCVRAHLEFDRLASAFPSTPCGLPAPVGPSLIARRSPSSPAMQAGGPAAQDRHCYYYVSACRRVRADVGGPSRKNVHVVDTMVQALFWDTTAVPVRVCNEEPYKNGSQKGIIDYHVLADYQGWWLALSATGA